MFATDPQKSKVLKNEGEQQRKERQGLLQRNQPLQEYFDKQNSIETRKISNKKEVQKTMDNAIKIAMAKNEKTFLI